ncbi:MAG: Rpn family recombination-promoting nuclease/putative transposase [Firmicutes bacterium]|nr:Rpn family recombination-promoting nuclease/putative transposase [Bacillota bacterium]
MKIYKPNERIPFTDEIMFSLVMRDENICRKLLNLILPDEEFGEIHFESSEDDLIIETEKTIRFPLSAHGVRLDAFIKSQNIWAEIEMQTYSYSHIAKRSRYYHANMDLEALSQGKPYRELPRSYVIFICTYDYMKADRPVYIFENFDRQNGLLLGDESFTILLNSKCSPEKVPEELRALFAYINDPTQGVGDDLVDNIERQVRKYNSEEWRRRHMTLQELMDRNYEQGLEQGRAEGEAAGMVKGELEAARKLARAMKADGEPVERISKYTGISSEEIEKL